jgi:predicted ester cyclase
VTDQETRDLFIRQQDYWKARDPEGLARCHTSDGVVISPIFRTVTGAAAILDSYRSLFTIFPDWDYRAEDLLVCGNRVAEPFTAKATHIGEVMGLAGTRKKLEIQGVRLFEMRENLIARERRYYDFTGMLIQLGVLKSKPGL